MRGRAAAASNMGRMRRTPTSSEVGTSSKLYAKLRRDASGGRRQSPVHDHGGLSLDMSFNSMLTDNFPSYSDFSQVGSRQPSEAGGVAGGDQSFNSLLNSLRAHIEALAACHAAEVEAAGGLASNNQSVQRFHSPGATPHGAPYPDGDAQRGAQDNLPNLQDTSPVHQSESQGSQGAGSVVLSPTASANPDELGRQTTLASASSKKQDPASATKIFPLRNDWIVSEVVKKRVETNKRLKKGQRPSTSTRGFVQLSQSFKNRAFEKMLRHKTFLSQGQSKGCVLMMNPNSVFRSVLDVLGVLLLFMDVILIPLQAFPLPESMVIQALNYFTLGYWTWDVIMSFCTGIYIHGELVMDWKAVAKQYISTYFFLDITIVALEWAAMGTNEEALNFASALRSLRILRFMRLLRLLRVVRLQRLIQSIKKRIQSIWVFLLIGIVGKVLGVVVIMHLLACAWYAVGTSTDSGWVSRFDNPSVDYMYWTSYHWAVCNLQGAMEVAPVNAAERFFAVMVALMALILASWFISTMTEQLMELKAMHHERRSQERILMNFLKEHKVTVELAVRVRTWLDEQLTTEQEHLQEVRLMRMLPQELQMDVFDETRRPLVTEHELFSQLYGDYPAALRKVCNDAMEEVYAASGDLIFAHGDACQRMLMVTKGRANYYLEDNDRTEPCMVTLVTAENPRFISEAGLWTTWQNTGDLEAIADCRILAVDAVELAMTLGYHEEAMVHTARYAKDFVRRINKYGCDDLGNNSLGSPEHRKQLDDAARASSVLSRQSSQQRDSALASALSDAIQRRQSSGTESDAEATSTARHFHEATASVERRASEDSNVEVTPSVKTFESAQLPEQLDKSRADGPADNESKLPL